MSYLIGIDAGTSAIKTVLFDEAGTILAMASYEYPLYQPENGWAEQNPEDWRKGTLQTLKEVLSQSKVNKEEIRGIGIAGQMHGLVMLDEEGCVIRPSIIWCDQRTNEEVEDMLQMMSREKWIELTANPPLTGWTAAKLLWVRKHEPQNYEKCRHILLPKDYIRYILTGEFATDVSDASGMQLLDVAHRCWSDKVLEVLHIDRQLLPSVYESYEITGTILPDVAELTGLSMQTVVVAGAGDNAAAAVGTGVVKEGMSFTTIGTSGVVFAHSDEMILDSKGRVHTCCHAVPNAWHVMGVTQAAGLSLKWFKDNFCEDYIQKAIDENIEVYELINQDIEEVPRGSDRLIYLPYLMGERTPHLDPDCRGVFFGLSAIHSKAHLLRAVMEGVSYSLCDCNDIIKEMGIQINQMMACGGGGKSPIWRQMLADLYNCHVLTTHQSEGPAIGAAILAGVGCGLYPSVQSACERLITVKSVASPVLDNVRYYKEAHDLYQELYRSLAPSYKCLAKLA